MRKLLLLLAFSLSLFANEQMMKNIYENVLLENVNSSIKTAKELKKSLEKNKLEEAQQEFKQLVVSWKKVETFYLAAEFNEDAIDIPRYIDVFHNLKENLKEQLQRIVESKDDLNVEMYKNSFKTINALEYVLFSQEVTQRHVAMATMMINNIIVRLDEIKHVYTMDSKRFLTDFKWANDVIINMLIDSTFKLKDWRIGDMAGFSRKYKGKPDSRRAEYYMSKTSKEAIQAILELHKEVMNSPHYDFGDMLIKNGFKKEVEIIVNEINQSLENLHYLKDENFEADGIDKLYNSTSKLHVAYYGSLVNALGVTSKILDADGD